MTVTTGAKASNDVVDVSSPVALVTSADRQANKPFVVYLTTANEKFAVEQKNVEETTLKDERISLAAKLFTMVKSDGDAISATHPFAKNLEVGGDLPRFVVFDSKGDAVGSIDGTVSPSKLFILMKKAAVQDYVLNVDGWVKDYQKILTEIDKLENLQKALSEKEGRAQTVAAQREVAQKKELYAKQTEELKAREDKLANPKRKGDEVAAR